MSGPSQTRQLGSARRLYYNSAGNLLGVDEISLIEVGRFTKNYKQYVSGEKHVLRTLFHLGSSDRVIAQIKVFGDHAYVDLTLNTIAWVKVNVENVLEVSTADLSQVGDEI